nr:HopW family type III effector protein [Pseudomonas syringae]
MPSHVKFGSFICLARARAAQLSESLNSNSGDVARLLHPHADTLLGLEKLPEALAALTENCPDTSRRMIYAPWLKRLGACCSSCVALVSCPDQERYRASWPKRWCPVARSSNQS